MQFRKSWAATFAVLLFLLCAGTTGYAASATQGYWQDVPMRPLPVGVSAPTAYRLLDLDANGLKARIAQGEATLALPTPSGDFIEVTLEDSGTMPAELAAKFPEIRSFRGKDSSGTHVRIDISPLGVNAMVFAKSGIWMVRPIVFGDSRDYISFNRADIAMLRDPFQCDVHDLDPLHPTLPDEILTTTGTTKRNYRAAVAANHNYVQAISGANPPTVALGLAAVIAAVNRVNEVYENDLSIHLTLVANNNLLIFPDAGTDPYQNGTGALGQNTGIINGLIGNANYDIGHVFTTGSGGVAGLGVVCNTNNKGRGTTGLSSPASLQSDTFYIDFVAHEMGHQFGGNHTFNNSCGGNRAASAAYEPGSGSTIMAYAGVCPVDLQPHSDPYFHAKSLQEITTFTNASGGACSVTAVNNASPVVAALSNYTIPARTPFALTGSATTTAPGATLKYGFEQYDLGAINADLNVDPGNGPIIRSLNPTVSPTRTVPKFANLLSGGTMIGEILPTTTRALNFRLTVFDNVLGGGTSESQDMTLQVNSTAGPFAVTAPATGATWDYANGTGTQTVTWNVAGTNVAPVSCANVDIDVYNGGDFSNSAALLAQGVPNNGSALVNVPNLATTTARVRVRCSNNIFFAMSPGNFTVLGSDLIFADGFEFGVVPSNPPTVSKAFAPASVGISVPSTLTITLGNTNAAAATLSSALTDTFPSGLVVATPPSAATTCPSGTVTAVAGSGSVSLSSGAQIPASGTCTVTVNVQAAAASSYANMIAAGALQTSVGNNAAAANAKLTVTGTPLDPPTVTKAFAPTSVAIGAPSTLTITLANPNATAATLTSALTDTFPSGLVVATPPSASTTCPSGTVTAVAGSGSASLSSGAQIPASGTCTVTVNVQAATAGGYANTIAAGALQTSAGNNAAAASANVVVTGAFPAPYCAVTYSDDVEPITSVVFTGISNTSSATVNGTPALENFTAVSGGAVAPRGGYTITLKGNSAGNFQNFYRVYFDWNHDGVFAEDGSESYDAGSITNSTGVDTKTTSTLVIIPPTVTPGLTRMRVSKSYGAYGEACGENGYGQSEDYTVLVDTSLVPPPVPALLAKSFAPNYLTAPGLTSTLTITLTNYNSGDLPLTAALTDTFPAGLVVAATPNASTTCIGGTVTAVAGAGSISLNSGAAVPDSATCTVKVDVTSAAAGIYLNTLPVGAAQTANGGNPTAATATVQVASPTGLPNYSVGFESPFTGSAGGTTLNNQQSWLGQGTNVVTTTTPAHGVQVARLTSTANGGTSGTQPLVLSPVRPAGTAPYSSLSANIRLTRTTNGATWEFDPQDSTQGLVTTRLQLNRTGNAIQVYDFDADSYTTIGTWTADTYFNLKMVVQRATGAFEVCKDGVSIYTDSVGNSVAGENITDLAIFQVPGAGQTASNTILFDDVVIDNPATGGCAGSPIAPSAATTFAPTSVSTAATSTLTVTLVNTSSATPAVLTAPFVDTFPANLLVAAVPNATTTCGGSGTVTANPGDGFFSLGSGAEIPAGATCTVSVAVRGAVSGSYVNTVGPGLIKSDLGISVLTGTATLTVTNPPTVAKAFAPDNVAIGTPSTLTITLGNANAQATLSSAFVDTFPAGMVVAPTPAQATTCTNGSGFTASAGAGSITLPANYRIPANGSCTVKVNVVAASSGTYTNTIAAGALVTNMGTSAVAATADLIVAGAIRTVTSSVSGDNGTIDPEGAQTVNDGGTLIFSLTPDSGYRVDSVGGTCGGTTGVNSYTTAPVTADCTVIASFTPNTYTVTSSVSGGNGTIDPEGLQTVSQGATPTFTLTPDSGYQAGAITGTCGGTPGVNSYTAAPVTANCTVIASFDVQQFAPTAAMAFSPTSIAAGATSVLTITLGNTNAFPVTLTTALTNHLPAGLLIAATPAASTTCASGTVTAVARANSVSLSSGAEIPANGSCTVSVNVSSVAAQTLVDTLPVGTLQTTAGSNTAAATDTLTITAGAFPAPYCARTFTSTVEPITLVDFAGISNTTTNLTGSANSPALENFTALVGTVRPGATYPLMFKGNTDGNFADPFRVYIDWNQDGVFAEDEMEFVGGGTIFGSTGIDAISTGGKLTVPLSAKPGLTRMRVVKINNTGPRACTTTAAAAFGQAEDYTINVDYSRPTIGQSFRPATITPGSISKLTVTLVNQDNTANAILSSAFTIGLPSGVVVAAAPNATTTCSDGSVTAAAGSTSVSLANGSHVPLRGSCTIQVDVTAAAAGGYAVAIANDTLQTTLGNNIDTASAVLNVDVPPSDTTVLYSNLVTDANVALTAGSGTTLMGTTRYSPMVCNRVTLSQPGDQLITSFNVVLANTSGTAFTTTGSTTSISFWDDSGAAGAPGIRLSQPNGLYPGYTNGSFNFGFAIPANGKAQLNAAPFGYRAIRVPGPANGGRARVWACVHYSSTTLSDAVLNAMGVEKFDNAPLSGAAEDLAFIATAGGPTTVDNPAGSFSSSTGGTPNVLGWQLVTSGQEPILDPIEQINTAGLPTALSTSTTTGQTGVAKYFQGYAATLPVALSNTSATGVGSWGINGANLSPLCTVVGNYTGVKASITFWGAFNGSGATDVFGTPLATRTIDLPPINCTAANSIFGGYPVRFDPVVLPSASSYGITVRYSSDTGAGFTEVGDFTSYIAVGAANTVPSVGANASGGNGWYRSASNRADLNFTGGTTNDYVNTTRASVAIRLYGERIQ